VKELRQTRIMLYIVAAVLIATSLIHRKAVIKLKKQLSVCQDNNNK